MSNDKFLKFCKEIVVKYFNEHADKTDKKQITEDDVFIVWSCKTLQNNKALVSTNVSDGMYYEITHNGDKHEIYVDAYKKWENFVVSVSCSNCKHADEVFGSDNTYVCNEEKFDIDTYNCFELKDN